MSTRVPSAIGTFVALALLSSTAAAQGWEVDPSLASIRIQGDVYADHGCPPNGGNVAIRPGANPWGMCPMGGVLPPLVPPNPPGTQRQQEESLAIAFPWIGFDFGTEVSPTARDFNGIFCGAAEAASLGHGYLRGDGLDSRRLRVEFGARVNNHGTDGDFADRGCVELTGDLTASIPSLPQTPHPVVLRVDFTWGGNAASHNECPGDPDCVQAPDDPEVAVMDSFLSINGTQLVLRSEVLDPLIGLPDFDVGSFSQDLTIPAGTASLDVVASLYSLASGELQYPSNEADGVSFEGDLVLYLIAHDFLAPPGYFRVIPAGGPGPRYTYLAGQSEITNQQYADFLNSAQLDGGATGLGSHMQFGPLGEVATTGGAPMCLTKAQDPASRLVYSPLAPLGTRYTVDSVNGNDPRTFESHPMTFVSWIGAVKFCNWLTLQQGLGAGARCYTEGPNAVDWHPVTISTADWATRDLTRAERGRLVQLHEGFRLPMDELGAAGGWVSSPVRPFNEWYRMAAHDPSAPATTRTGPGGETVPPRHHVYGFGRDLITFSDANFFQSGDPYDDDDAFVAMYDGSAYNQPGDPLVGNGAVFTSAATSNPYGLLDLSGNIAEWGQDQVPGLGFALHGGSWNQTFAECAAGYREARAGTDLDRSIGFRVVRSQAGKIAPHAAPTGPVKSAQAP